MRNLRAYIKGLLNIRDVLRANLLNRTEVISSMESDWVVSRIVPEYMVNRKL